MAVNRKIAFFASVFMFFSFLLCLFTMAYFVKFLSFHTSLKYFYNYDQDFKHASYNDSIFISTIQNLSLIGIFALQHSLQASYKFKNFLHSKSLDVFERSLYNCGSCISLQILMYFWKSIPSITCWEISTYDHPIWWWVFSTTHFIFWVITYSGCFIMDFAELLGVKQVYHYVLDWPQPLDQKSVGLKRFYSHMRHSSFFALVVILFVHPVMQIDRLLLAHVLTIYMFLRFKVDDIDYAYQRRMLHRKYRDLDT